MSVEEVRDWVWPLPGMETVNGHIIVESKVNKGTSFIVELPVSHNALEEIATEERVILETQFEIGSDPRPLIKHIDKEFHLPILLIVEDNQDVTEYLISILEETYHVEVAKNGNEGFERALSHVPDIILSDVMMPEMDGINMLGMLKKDIRTSHIPVILLTAKADINRSCWVLEQGPKDTLKSHSIRRNSLFGSKC